MITAFRFLGEVYGAQAILAYVLIAAAVYFAVCFLIKRKKAGISAFNIIIGFVISEGITDIIWNAVFFNDGEYVNLGIAGAPWLAVWAVLLLIFGIIAVNKKK